MTWEESHRRVVARNLACVDVLAVACEHDHGSLDFDDPRRSIEAVEVAAARLMEEHDWEDAVAALAMMAANLLRCAVGYGIDDPAAVPLERVKELLDRERQSWTQYQDRV